MKRFLVVLLILCSLGCPSMGMAGITTVTYIYTDGQGSPVAEADSAGNVTATFDYTPYGSTLLGAQQNGPGYTGHVADPDTALTYMQARYYDPSMGRFLSVDPVIPMAGQMSSFGTYAYANNNPYRYTDPDGRCPTKEGCTEAVPFNWFTDTLPGWLVGHVIGDPIAVFRQDSYNPLRNEFLDRGQLQDAKIGLVAMAIPGAGAEASAGKTALRKMAQYTREKLPRRSLGADGARSLQIIEREGEEVLSRTHQVIKKDEIVHQHQNLMGKYGGERQFPDEWTGKSTINAPYDNVPPTFPADKAAGGRSY